MIDAIAQFALEAEEDDEVRVVVLAAAGDYFSVGMDRGRPSGGDAPGIHRNRRTRFPEAAWRNWTLGHLFQMAKPSIAAVNGMCAGGGLSFSLECDIRIASEKARFTTVYSKTGMPAIDAVGVLLPAAIGMSRALELIWTSRVIDAQEAERIGLVNEIVPTGTALSRAQEMAHEIAALPQGAIRSDKETVLRGVGRTLEERLRIEAEMIISMFMRRDSHTLGAAAFKAGNLKPDWPNHGL
jgi:enoyl-CoA hydratase/carnithine racemase